MCSPRGLACDSHGVQQMKHTWHTTSHGIQPNPWRLSHHKWVVAEALKGRLPGGALIVQRQLRLRMDDGPYLLITCTSYACLATLEDELGLRTSLYQRRLLFVSMGWVNPQTAIYRATPLPFPPTSCTFPLVYHRFPLVSVTFELGGGILPYSRPLAWDTRLKLILTAAPTVCGDLGKAGRSL